MKNKSARHKDFNTFKFLPFSERVANIDVDIFHKVGHEYELQAEENSSYFYQTIEKWNVLNLSESYECFRKEIRAHEYITLPQVLLSKDHIVEILKKHLKLKNPLCLQPLLEIVVAVAKDLQKEFYDYYPQFLEIIIDLLNTKDTEQLEWTFTCLAYLFKLLWRSLVKNINHVFNALLPLLSDTKPEYINSFAAESFAFVTRKVKDRKAFLTILLKSVKNRQDGVMGCGKLLFQVINGVDGQFHSCADIMLPFLLESLSDEKLTQSILFEILEHVLANIVTNIQPHKSELLWSTFTKILDNLFETFRNNQDDKIMNNIELILKLIGQSIEYKGGKLLQQPVPLIQQLMKLLSGSSSLEESVVLTATKIGILVLLSKNIKIPQEHVSSLIRKILSLPQKSILLYFVDNITNYSSFEALILPKFLKHCVLNQLNDDCFHILTKMILKKVPTCGTGINLCQWKKYLLDFRENNTQIMNIMLNYITVNNIDTVISNFDNYICGLICLPHLNTKETKFVIEKLEKNIVDLLEKINTEQNNDDKQEIIRNILFLLNATVECVIHLSGNDILARNFTTIIDSLLHLTTYPEHILSLRTISLCLTTLKDNTEIITMETLLKINNILENNFSSPFHEVRLLTSHIYTSFEVLSDFKLRHTADPEVQTEDFKIFTICYNVESTESHVHTYRNQLQNLEKLSFDKPQMLMCNQTPFKTIPLRYLCGTLYLNFQLLWEPVTKIIASQAHGLEINTFWNIFGVELKNVCDSIRNPREVGVDIIETRCEFLRELLQENQMLKIRPDFNNYRLLLWKSMAMFADVAEAKTRDISELLLNFIELEYVMVNSDVASVCSIKENFVDEDKNNEVNTNEENSDEDTRKRCPNPSFKPRGKTSIKTLLHKLNVFSHVKSPMSMYREPELFKLYFDLLQHKDSSIQKAALDCIMTYKHKYLIPYKENLYNLVDDKNFKHEITTFQVNKESDVIRPEHRENLIPIVMQIVFSKMSVKTGLRTGGKSSGQMRRNLILRFLAGCQEIEMLSFIQKAFRFYTKYLDDDPEIMVNLVLNNVNLEKCIPPKKLQSTINLLNVVLEQFGGLMGNELLTYLLKILLIVGAIIKGVFDQLDQVHAGFLSLLRNLRTSCIKIVGRFFEHFERYHWCNKQINAIFIVFVWPYLNKLNIEGIHSPTTLLKLFTMWGSNPRYFPLLVKQEEGKTGQYILPHIIELLVNEKSHITVVNAIEEMLEKLLSLQPDEEDEHSKIPVDNMLPIKKDILDRIGLIDKLNYGSCILLPHVPIILIKIKKKLSSKMKNLNQRELFILSRISELVWEADISDTILELLLPVVLKKCSISIGEEIVLRYLTTILNLIKNVAKPQYHLKEISPLFSEISYSSCRKVLTQILETIADKSEDKDLKTTSHLITELNAWDAKWLDQPDFERRHNAFKKIQQTISENNIEVPLGILLINNFYFLIKSEKDLSLKENSVHSLKLLCPVLINKYKNEHKQIDYILNNTIFTLIRDGLRHSKEDVRNECISLLGHLARECSESHFILRDLNIYTNKADPEVDFFENLTHLQIHRHARALLKFCQITREQVAAPNPRTLTQFILPLASHYLCTEKYSNKNSVIDAAIETIGVVCKILPWHQYEGLLKYYLGKLRYKVEYQKQLVRLTVTILDAFHFDLSKAHPDTIRANTNHDAVVSKGTVQNEVIHQVETETTNDEVEENDITKDTQIDEVLDNENFEVDVEDEEEEMDNPGPIKICEKTVVLCKSTATRVVGTIQMVLLPQLHKSLAELTQHDNSHKVNRRKTGFEREDEDLLRVPISLAVVKLLQRLPVQILELNLPGVFMKLCTFLKSQLESVRRVTRETLQKIILTLGPKYLSLLLAQMTPLLSRGFQVHVLVYTVHGVLNCLKDMYGASDIDKVLLTVLNLCTADLFGALSEEKEIAKIAVKVSEAKSIKSYATLQIVAQYITESCLMDLIVPIKQVLDSSHSYKIVHKAQEALRYISFGLVDNTFISTESLLKFAYGTASEQIPELAPARKRILSEKEREKLQRETEDCFIIPKIPGSRTAYRKQNVKTSGKTNAHLLVEFGLRLCYVMLKREKVKDEDYKPFIDPFVMVFQKCIKSKQVKLSTLTLQCLSWIMKYDLPSMRQNIKSISKDIFAILHKYASAGLSKGDNFDLVMAAFKAMAILVRDVKYYTIDTNQLKVLLLYAEQDMHDHDRQATAFNLLKAIIARKLIVPEINEVMEKVAELSITSELNYVRAQSRTVFHLFLMEYPLGNTLEKHLGFYISQMSYELQYGRESAIEMIQTLINTFPLNVLKSHCGTLLISLGARLVNDEVPECRKMVAECLSSMLHKLPKTDRDSLYDIIIVWLKDKNISHRRLAAQLCGIFVSVEKINFESRLPTLTPLILKQFGLDNSPGKFVKLQKGESEESEEHQRVKDHHLFQVLQLLLKVCAQCKSFLREKDVIENLAVHVQTLLAYPHDWVRLAAAQFLGFVLSAMNIEYLSELIVSNKSDTSGYLCTDPINAVKSLTLDLCDQLQANGITSDLAEQVIKNLVFVARVLQKIPVKDNNSDKKINLLWLTKRMRKVVNTEIVENSSSIILRTEVFKWIAGVGTALDVDRILPILHHLLAPLVREMITTDEKNAPLRQLSKEVANLLKNKVGMEEYTSTLSKLQQTLSVKRAERKRSRTQLAVTDPEMFAKKKIKRHEKKKESKKRKLAELKGTKKTFKKRKVVDLEDNSEVM